MQAINECLKRTTNETLLSDLVNNALDIAVTLEGTTKTVLANFESSTVYVF